jgi:hypothetical protein
MVPVASASTFITPPARRPLPPLAQGDRLSRSEFLQRYAAMPGRVRAERIEGIVHMAAAAVSAGFHGQPLTHLLAWLANYELATPGVVTATDSTVHLDLDNDPQPDACLRILESHGGAARLDAEGFIVGSPELTAEIAGSSAAIDLGAKLNVYRRNGIREYIVHRTYDAELDWFVLRDGQYVRQTPDSNGILRSEVFPGLWLKTDAMIVGRLSEVMSVLQQGLVSDEHSKFVAKLAGERRGSDYGRSKIRE